MVRVIIFTLALITLLFGPTLLSNPVKTTPIFAQDSPTTTPSTAEDKLKQLNMLMGEHAFLAGQLTISRYENKPDFDETLVAINNNTKDMATLIGDFYPDQAEDQFLTIWNRHINAFVSYADAKRTGDRNKESQAISSLQKFTQDLANLLSRGNNGMFTASQNYLAQHVLLEKKVLDSYIDKDYTTMYDSLHDAYIHAATLTDNLR